MLPYPCTILRILLDLCGELSGGFMAEVILREHLDTDPVECIKQHIKSAEDAKVPISRFGLSEIIAEQTGIAPDEARAQVDDYCDIAARHLPDYLSKEFHLFWPKVVAFAFAVAGMGVFWYGMTLFRAKHPAWLWFCMGTILFGIGLFQWVRSLERYQIRHARKLRDKRERLRAKYAKPR